VNWTSGVGLTHLSIRRTKRSVRASLSACLCDERFHIGPEPAFYAVRLAWIMPGRRIRFLGAVRYRAGKTIVTVILDLLFSRCLACRSSGSPWSRGWETQALRHFRRSDRGTMYFLCLSRLFSKMFRYFIIFLAYIAGFLYFPCKQWSFCQKIFKFYKNCLPFYKKCIKSKKHRKMWLAGIKDE
jgi:hypothetical protein